MHIREFFYINKSDRSVLAVLLVFAVVVFGLLFWLGRHDENTFVSEADSVATENPFSRQYERNYSREDFGETGRQQAAERFPFDPNTATADELLRLGLKPWQVKNMMKYRERGGVYRKPADFARLYGLTKEKFKELEPYIRINDDAHRPAAELFAEEEKPKRDTLRFPVKLREGEQIALDQLDTTSLQRVPGIGRYFARKIVEHGRRLGGYASVSQLKEIDGFPDEALPYFTIDAPHVRKLNLNTLTLDQLKRHPYLNFYQARAIVDRRRLHGALKSLDDLRLLPEFSPEVIQRLQPYVEF
ncbi:MAG: helix-hairpin-helix domain-containing protein [Prevotella sp.]|nr:helix-hairpin-helix domain-containing protein [Prevotella sp.]